MSLKKAAKESMTVEQHCKKDCDITCCPWKIRLLVLLKSVHMEQMALLPHYLSHDLFNLFYTCWCIWSKTFWWFRLVLASVLVFLPIQFHIYCGNIISIWRRTKCIFLKAEKKTISTHTNASCKASSMCSTSSQKWWDRIMPNATRISSTTPCQKQKKTIPLMHKNLARGLCGANSLANTW